MMFFTLHRHNQTSAQFGDIDGVGHSILNIKFQRAVHGMHVDCFSDSKRPIGVGQKLQETLGAV